MQKSIYYDGTKAIPIEALDRMLWPEFFGATDDTITESEAYRFVAWVYRAVQLRANALSSVPFTVQTTAGVEEERINFQDILPGLLQLTEASLCLYGEAYWLKEINLLGGMLGLRWAVARTIEPVTHKHEGLVGFKRRLEGEAMPLDVEDLVYFWLPDPNKELGPGQAPAQVAVMAAGIAHNVNRFAATFFERGAISPTILQVDGNPGPVELQKLESWWTRLSSGISNAWSTRALRKPINVHRLTQDLSDMAMPELTQSARQQISTAFGIPQSMLEDAANFATAREHRTSFWRETIIPEANWIAGALNEQLFIPMGLEFNWVFEDVEILQKDEAEKTESIARMVELGIVSPMEAREMLNIAERSEEIDEADFVEDAEEKALDLKRWQKVALKELGAGKNPGKRFFRSSHIGVADYEAIQSRLLTAETEEEVKAAFSGPFHFHGWEGYP